MNDVGARSATGDVYEILRMRIGLADLKPGTPLRQDHLAAEFGVSHVPVREALMRLVSDGLANSRLNRGTTVSSLSEVQALEIADYRAVLEARLITLAIPNLSRKDLSRAERTLNAIDREMSLEKIFALNAAFHADLYMRAGRPFFMRSVETARLNLGRYLYLTWLDPQNAKRSQTEHREILRLCQAGDDRGASSLVLTHIGHTGQMVSRIIREELFGPDQIAVTGIPA